MTPPSPDAIQILQRLIAFDTTNPPGNEAACVGFIHDLLSQSGIPSTLLAHDSARPNLIARLPGRDEGPPFLMYGHVDCVAFAGQAWTCPPLSGEIRDGFIWGRGALDMKGGVAMMLAAMLRAKAEGLQPPGDVIFAALADEEDGGDAGARFLVREHPDQFRDVRYAIGEFGGFTMALGGKTLYPIMVAEKRMCWLKATFRGRGGHGSMPVRGGAMARLALALLRLDRRRLPVHITPAATVMLNGIGDSVGGAAGLALRLLLKPGLTDFLLNAMGEQLRLFDPLLHNTVSPTGLQASDKINVIPSEISVSLDGRLLPGQTPEQLLVELRAILGNEVEVEIVRSDPGPAEPDMGLFPVLAGVLKAADPAGIPVALLLSGVTDARFFSTLGIQTYGFTPMQLPPDFRFTEVIHAADERIPVDAVAFGADAIYRLLQRLPCE
ncbi:MAG: M20/M25/M40 family metallo-hydrolase [Anaerolineae bacterium]|nr:M20/M25/M40 family metallo-hydrolase [Anaerolineae bacterium]